MYTDRDREVLDPPVVFGKETSVSTLNRPRLGMTHIVSALSLLFVSFVAQPTNASTPLAPFEGSATIIAGRNVAGREGARYRLPEGIQIALGPHAEASIASQPQMLALKAGKRTPTYSVFLSSGSVDVQIPDATGGAVAVAGPADVRVIAQRGRVSTLASGHDMYALSTKYPLLVSQKDRLSTLPPGVVRQFSGSTPPADHPALSAPQWLAGRPVWLALPTAVRLSNFAWSAVPGAEFYRVVLSRENSGQTVAQFVAKSTRLGDELPPVTAGNYHLVVRATDRLGLPGLESSPFRIQVVGVEVPPGAQLKPDARIELAPTQTIQLNNAEGLSLTRSRERAKRPASAPVGVVDGQPTPLVIQGEDSSSPCLVWLLPSRTPVTAHAGPKWAIWPQQTVVLEVRWTDGLGNRLGLKVEPVVNVFVGIEPVDVVWDKEPDYWRAVLPPQPGHGPWVVRLEVRDQQGGLLARDFVEVTERPRHRAHAASASLDEF
jgi:hypothetical protein